jgi:large subunit ribosomal protein L4
MTLDVVNSENERVGTLEVSDELVAGPAKLDLVWESVVCANASERRGTHATKNRARVSGTGKKPWRQKGTGRARVGESRNPLWRKGGTVFGPMPRSYAYQLPRKAEIGALRAAFAQKLRDKAVVVVEALPAEETKTKGAQSLLVRLGANGRTLLTDVSRAGTFARAVGNLPHVAFVTSGRLRARDVIGADRVIATRAAVERLSAALRKEKTS